MKITIFLIAMFIAAEAYDRGYSLFALVIVFVALWEAFLRNLALKLTTAIRNQTSRLIAETTKFIMALRRILLPRLLGKEKFEKLFNADGSPRRESNHNPGLSLIQFFFFYVFIVLLIFAIGVNDTALFFAESFAEYMGKPLSEDLILNSKMLVYVILGGGAFTLLCGAIIDLVFGKGTFSLD